MNSLDEYSGTVKYLFNRLCTETNVLLEKGTLNELNIKVSVSLVAADLCLRSRARRTLGLSSALI